MMEMIADMQAAVKITHVAKPRCRLAGAIEVRERQLVKWLPSQTLSLSDKSMVKKKLLGQKQARKR